MEMLHSDAFVFFGATGDLAYKEIFTALQAILQRAFRSYGAERVVYR